MKIQSLAKLFFQDSATSRFQDNVFSFVSQLTDNPFLRGSLIENSAITTSDTKIAHKLGVKPLGYLITTQNANAVIYQTASDETYLTLKASANVTASIWVF